MAGVVVPVGVTRETVEGALRSIGVVDVVYAVTVPGYEDVKRPILDSLKGLAVLVGARYYEVVVVPGDVSGFVELYELLVGEAPDPVYLVGVTGSRYLLPPLFMVLLWYWRTTGARVLLLHGIEGEAPSPVPLAGFFAPVMRLSRVQGRILELVYGGEEVVSGKDLKEKYGFSHSVYAVLRDLERKGLLVVRRGRIERTLPGELMYRLYVRGGD